MKTRIIVDSASDLPQNYNEILNVIPLIVSFEEEEFLDGVTLNSRQFYEKLIESDTIPKTSQITPARYEEEITKVLQDADDVLIITLSSKLSGTYQSACIAAEGFDGKVSVVDSLNATCGEAVLVELAIKLVNEGKNAKEVAAILEKEREKVKLIALLDTLEYLKKGGRISSAVALAGNLLSLKPVVAVVDGEVKLLGTARGSKKGNNYLIEEIGRIGGVNFDKPYFLAYTGLSDDLLQKYVSDCGDLWKEHTSSLPEMVVGSTIGTHIGPGAIAVAFFEK